MKKTVKFIELIDKKIEIVRIYKGEKKKSP